MSKRINVNPGQYKVAGREHMGENMTQGQQKQAFAQAKAGEKRAARPPAARKPRKERTPPR